jgi:hypothetical protein
VPDGGVRPAHDGEVVGQPGGLDDLVEAGRGTAQRDVLRDRPGQHPRHLRHVRDPARAQVGLGDRLAVPPDHALGRDDPGERAQQAGLAGTDLAGEQHQLARTDLEVDALDADGAVVVHRGELLAGQPRERDRGSGLGGGRGARPQVDARGQPGRVRGRGQRADVREPAPGGGRLGDDGRADLPEVAGAREDRADQQCGRQVPGAYQVQRPRQHDPGLRKHARDPLEQGLQTLLADDRTDPGAVDRGEVPADRVRGGGELHGAHGVEGGGELRAEAGARVRGRATGPPDERRADRRRGRTEREHPGDDERGARVPGRDPRQHDDECGHGQVHPVVQVDDHALGVQRAGDDLARGGAGRAAGLDPSAQHREPHPQRDGGPPQRIRPEREGDPEREGQQDGGERGRRGPRCLPRLQRGGDLAPQRARRHARRTADDGEGEQRRAGEAPARVGDDQPRDRPPQRRGVVLDGARGRGGSAVGAAERGHGDVRLAAGAVRLAAGGVGLAAGGVGLA